MTVENDKCGICKEETDCDFVTRCGHWFHENCLKPWLFCRKDICPYCNHQISFSKTREKLGWNMKKLKINEQKMNAAIKFFESHIESQSNNSALCFAGHGSSITIPPYELDTLKILLAAGWNINDKVTGAKPLFISACEKDDFYRLNFLFESGLHLEKDGEWHKQAVIVANSRSSLVALKTIEKYFSTTCIKRTEDGNTPLHEACLDDDFELVKTLIESGAPVNARNRQGATPLHMACSSADIEVINYLIERGAEINCVDLNGKSPLHEAVLSEYDRENVLKRFLELKANLNFLDQNRNTLLHAALINQQFDNAEILLDHVEDINALNCFGESVLHIAADLAPGYLIDILLERGCDPKLKDSNGNTALHRAVSSNTVDVVEALLEDNQSEVNALDGNNRSALILAMKRVGCSSFARLLIDHGADMNIKGKDGKCALDLCLEKLCP